MPVWEGLQRFTAGSYGRCETTGSGTFAAPRPTVTEHAQWRTSEPTLRLESQSRPQLQDQSQPRPELRTTGATWRPKGVATTVVSCLQLGTVSMSETDARDWS